ncbi:solute carrier family 49 member 4 isoform X3 [Nilaparvata lugens]|uniref:solute carrier family 49 member 4 isoform X2 n=1 Tax=Nilaparvata lugens TaxID=108931 RepID=UPI00193E24F8|nr:solute carrier family 49 member 4 isoform X2 [Nilaparvata lugens]XP_039280537.1 solute carrier family 49 member 4 isoform X3 [Nilaparvata lugens]
MFIVVVWNTWGPISKAALFAFQSWDSGSVAMFSNWGSVCIVLLVGPVCWLLDVKGLKYSSVLAAGLCCVGAGLRCLPVDETLFTWLSHIGGILNGIGGVIFGPAVVLLSSTWFPAHERTSATGLMSAMSYFGMAASYMIGPTFVTPSKYASWKTNNTADVLLERIRVTNEIKNYLYFDFAVELLLFLSMIFIFPSNPPKPPSRSSCLSLAMKRNFMVALKDLLQNGNIWLLGMSAFFNFGMSGPWLSQLPVLLSDKSLSQDELSKLGTWTIISSCVLGASVSRASDMFQGKLKIFLLCFMTIACSLFMRILYIIEIAIDFNKYDLILLIMVGFSASCATSPLFYEFAAEIAYPVSEVIVAGFIMTLTNLANVIIYFYISKTPNTALQFMSYGLVFNNLMGTFLMIMVEEQYNRLIHDDPNI